MPTGTRTPRPIYISGSESDCYGILGVDTLADDEAVKKQYKKLALLLHPDKTRLNGAEGAFKLVLDAWSLLSDKAKRVSYDHQKRKKKEKKSEPEPPPAAAAATREDHPKRRFKKTEKRARQEEAGKAK
ncbi:hypothetical protein F2Q68_00035175 [Brassica cretica]|uniref:J domain-containing protein n=1 Tax=Brassica cretica TaxID=69181 RepID=A0A8S9H8K0_BRACR|nr:hypothetical protein F2Q68_00035175 [Brassica cretica]